MQDAEVGAYRRQLFRLDGRFPDIDLYREESASREMVAPGIDEGVRTRAQRGRAAASGATMQETPPDKPAGFPA